MAWGTAGKKVALGCGSGISAASARSVGEKRRLAHSMAKQTTIKPLAAATTTTTTVGSADAGRPMSSSSVARVKKQALERDVIVSVLESSATRRDAKGYLQKYAANQPSKPESDKTTGLQNSISAPAVSEPINIAVMMLRDPQHLVQSTLDGIARTIAQLRALGLLSAVVIECTGDSSRQLFDDEALRLCEAIDNFGKPGAKLISDIFLGKTSDAHQQLSAYSNPIKVSDRGLLKHAFQHELIPVVTSVSARDELHAAEPASAEQTVLALTAFLSGLQFGRPPLPDASGNSKNIWRPEKIASVERVILLDALGGTPTSGRGVGVCHRFINLEQEYDRLRDQLLGPEGSPATGSPSGKPTTNNHVSNLTLAKETLTILPPSSSALITTPLAAANTSPSYSEPRSIKMEESQLGFDGMVTTRKKHNPILHNLLTDKPMYSSSLPLQRIQDGGYRVDPRDSTAATLVKRGMPLTIYPDPRENPWRPPQPGAPRCRLTDKNVDLPRLVHLIDDSFGRKLDVQHYMDRVKDNLAGIIIAGEYEGGAILTWEKPEGVTDQEAYERGLWVPYLDKFAVLRSRQGSGGVADIVFNAMVRDCFPEGVCWRSRKNNPVNKWYFERSVGTIKLSDSNWAMFWTTLGLCGRQPKLQHYESVCRSVQPSWADNNHIVD
ncbi:acetylglutamate synthase [Cordyceps fumosorosea ARSEF 2679]|uniref:Amino-acid acetyltransferase, mitochondrial n=1 Tax=Cordyceps fumosorosea (strain ARSEF 2679) TaxID=1081104 RepID=A0A168AQG0_CORFA|nr:acetylglutamate synthase [Cordyceps fumosorosea ARSEF 2679]OAA69053.1 acetylglutamate synthase [Cordyceps fumosorosea ARSEF 2679]